MNTCIKCGKEIPDGELFCRDCSLSPEEFKASARKKPDEAPVSRPAPKKKVTDDTIRLDPIIVKKPVGLIVALVIVSVIAAGCLGYILKTHTDMSRQKNQLRSAEASAQQVQNQVSSLEQQLTDAQTEIAGLESEKAELDSQISSLNSQLHGQTSQSNQDAYENTAREQEITRLTTENENLSTQLSETKTTLTETQTRLDELTETVEGFDKVLKDKDDEIEKLNGEVTELEDENTEYLKKVTFMDKFVVFVENDGSGYYHTYDCPDFKKKDFWVFNPSYAKDQGYTPCPNCH